ncbi:hypothetical protein B0A52_08095 [Exophiala mesophila]|uniref:Nudix hydrolase domain-containing protein n=1 Tax=Exophiala mesophila TaxID=212818 RepID=A0A438MWR8_EXOME|nr:hypothetical protein B0A52_08095 [Exophiala mesophila]
MARFTNLELAKDCDNFPYFSDNPQLYEATVNDYYHFLLEGCPSVLGYVSSKVAERFPASRHWEIDANKRTVTFQPRDEQGSAISDFESRNAILADYLQSVREQRVFGVLDGWRSERYPIYGPNKEILLSMERSATPLFGVVTYGIHMTGYVKTDQGMKIWAPRRALNKQTYPGMMDNTVAGGLTIGELPFDCLVREAEEEASLPADLVRTAKACGTLTYFHVRDARAVGETGLCQPEVQYIYDLEMPPDIVPKPGDNEAIDFQLLTVEEVQTAMANGKFKPNCAHLLLEFFVRHGIMTAENEPDYLQIVSKLHRRLEFPMR